MVAASLLFVADEDGVASAAASLAPALHFRFSWTRLHTLARASAHAQPPLLPQPTFPFSPPRARRLRLRHARTIASSHLCPLPLTAARAMRPIEDFELKAPTRAALSRSASTESLKLSRTSTIDALPDLPYTPPASSEISSERNPWADIGAELARRERRGSGAPGETDESEHLELLPVDKGKGAWGFVLAGFFLECVGIAVERCFRADEIACMQGVPSVFPGSRVLSDA